MYNHTAPTPLTFSASTIYSPHFVELILSLPLDKILCSFHNFYDHSDNKMSAGHISIIKITHQNYKFHLRLEIFSSSS